MNDPIGNGDLKRYRAPRNPWPWIIAAAVVIAYLTHVGPSEYADALSIEAENKVLRVELAKLRRPQAQVAPIRPRCPDPQKQEFHAWQSDGGKWRAKCRDGFITAKVSS